jgi:hypothetical protein
MRHFGIKTIACVTLLGCGCVGVVTFFVLAVPLLIEHRCNYPIDFDPPLTKVLVLGACGIGSWFGFHLLKAGGDRLWAKVNRVILIFVGIIVTVVAVLSFFASAAGSIGIFSAFQEIAGQRYMDSLTPKDIETWIDRSTRLMDSVEREAHGPVSLQEENIPIELRKIHVLGVNVGYNSVCYLWAGGMGCSYLQIERNGDGTFDVVEQGDSMHRKAFSQKR